MVFYILIWNTAKYKNINYQLLESPVAKQLPISSNKVHRD